MKAKLKFFIALAVCAGLVYLLNRPLGMVPPIGKFLDPFNGAWQNALQSDIPGSKELIITGLNAGVQVVYNDRGVPHIFARNERDLCFAAGYIMASHRLWQMEFIALAATGRLSEVLGDRTLEFDRYTRRMGMTYGAEKMVEDIRKDPQMLEQMNAYTEGINAWIDGLSPRQYPFEYKLLDYSPEPWNLVKSTSVIMYMNRDLTFANSSLRMSALKAMWGEEAVVAFLDTPPKFNETVVSRRDWDFPLMPPAPPVSDFLPQFILDSLVADRDPGIGSNNWAVSGALTESGYPMLATDPHLSATLPAIWFEMQLQAPGINVYGVTVPGGGPFIVMGFNEKIAWGNTNTGNQMLDIYEIELDDNETSYFYNNEWVPLKFRYETYQVKGGKSITDTIPWTHHGPIMYRSGEKPMGTSIPVAHAISWAALEGGNAPRSFYRINRAEGVSDFREALSTFNAPTQNYGMASADGDIVKQLNGLWPMVWNRQGMFISDGRRPEYDWNGYVPFEYLPYEVNPPRGFVSSANQRVAENYPFYHGWSFANSARANIINRTLSEEKKFTVDDMKALQLNSDNFWAGLYLDRMLDSLMAGLESDTISGNYALETAALGYLRNWNRVNEAESVAATLFDRWVTEISLLLWKPFTEPVKKFNTGRPATDITFMVLFHEPPADVYAKLFGTLPATAEILARGFKNAMNYLAENQGAEIGEWHWWRVNGLTVNHLLNIGALNQPRQKVNGSANSPNAIRGSHAPSWRMVVSWGEPMQAWGIYPGGQSGNPATRGYNAFISDYAAGNYYPLKLYPQFEVAAAENKSVLTLSPE
ncbi:MAG: penicillin acylase family protein [Bacteroidota bacterium]